MQINRKAHHDYFLFDKFEAGMILQGWEVKSLRSNKLSFNDSYITVKNGKLFWINALIEPLKTTVSYSDPQNNRYRELLLNKHELHKLKIAIEQKGMTIVPVSVYLKNNCFKLEIAVAKGKKSFDIRNTDKERSWKKEKESLMKQRFKSTIS